MDHSPAWKNPRDVLKVFQKNSPSSSTALSRRAARRRITLTQAASLDNFSHSQPSFPHKKSPRKSPKKRKNPFCRTSPRKKAPPIAKIPPPDLLEEECTANFSNSRFLTALENTDVDKKSGENAENFHTDFRCLLEEEKKKNGVKKAKTAPIFAQIQPNLAAAPKIESRAIPIDLRLTSQLKVVSKRPFPWLDSAASRGLNSELFMAGNSNRILGLNRFTSRQPLTAAGNNELISSILSLTYYYSMPDFAWLQTFPRHQQLYRRKEQGRPTVASLGEHVNKQLAQNWESSLEFLYQSLKRGNCHLFYVCCPNFTIMFANLNKNDFGGDGIRVVITPASRGLRQRLRDEKIQFVPLSKSASRRSSRDSTSSHNSNTTVSVTNQSLRSVYSSSSTDNQAKSAEEFTQSQPPPASFALTDLPDFEGQQEGEENQHDSSGDSDDFDWLLETGVSPLTIQKIRRSSSERSMGSSKSKQQGGDADGLQSAVLLTGPLDSRALVTLMKQQRFCWPLTGTQAGMPPTLISATPFERATLNRATVRCYTKTETDTSQSYVLELTDGPILPHCAYGLMRLFSGVLPQFHVWTNVLDKEPYVGFNELKNTTGNYLENKENEGTFLGDFSKSDNFANFKEILFENGLYSY